jgi:hypothetical protein
MPESIGWPQGKCGEQSWLAQKKQRQQRNRQEADSRKTLHGIARCAHNGWSREGASWCAVRAGITCPARITTDRGAVGGNRKTALRKGPKKDMLRGSGPGCRRIRVRMRRKLTWH